MGATDKFMKTFKRISLYCVVISSLFAAVPAMAREFGASYGREFKENNDVEQYELFYREPLPFQREFDSGFRISSDVEIAAALIREADSDNDEGGRFSIMPQLILSPQPHINLVLGIGAGFMVGNTNFADQDLGGELLLNAKVGLQFLLGQHWSLGYFYYHQSNAGIYDENQGLNMNNVLLSYSF